MRRLFALSFLAITASASAQAPDVVIKLDARVNYRTAPNDSTTQRLYDSLGRYSIVSLSFKLEPGFRVYAGQKLQRFNGGNDSDFLDEYYVEDEGIWRFGKQYVPFGAGKLVRESVMAARGDTDLLVEGFPIAAAYCQGEKGRQEGVVGRIGGRLGFSVFYGNNFGIDGTSLAYVRKPEEAAGRGRGYKQAYAIDYSKGFGPFMLAVEGVAFRQPNQSQDNEFEVVDLSATYTPSKYQSYVLGWTHRTKERADFWRMQGSVFLTRNVFLEPMVRYRNGETYDFSLAVRVRL